MNTKTLLKSFVSRGAVIYTAGSLLILLFSLALPENSAARILSPTPFIFFAAYAYVMSLGSALFTSGKFSPAIARLVHAVCYNAGFLCFLLLCSMGFTTSVILTSVYALIYTASVFIVGAFKKNPRKNTPTSSVSVKAPTKAKKEKAKPESTYQNRFS